MKGWIRKTWLGCAVALALGVPLAHAEGGVITFVGAIVAPTCTTADVGASTPGVSRGGCGEIAGQVAAHTSVYRQQLVTLEGSAVDNRLLSYFAGYTAGTDARLLTRTYE
jgi:type 1 fimbria pilin